MHGLFRRQAVEAQRQQSLGNIRLATPVSHQVWGAFAAGVTAVIVSWLCLGHYTRREHVAGSLVPQAGLLTVASRSAGIVSKLDVQPGAHVTVGEVLLTVSSDENSAASGDTDAAVARSLQQQKTQVRASLAALPEQTSDQASDLRSRIKMLATQVRQIESQLALERTKVAAANSLISKAEPLLRRGYVSMFEMDQYRANALNDRSQVKELERQRLDTEQQRSELIANVRELPLTTATTRHQLRIQLAQINAAIAQNDVAREEVFRATHDGTVTSILVEPGQSIAPGQSLLSVLPDGSPLEAQLLVPSSAIGFVHEGTPVVLHYQAFPYQKFGVQQGTVAEVSRNALTPIELTALLGQTPSSESLYLVKVKLARQSIEAYGKRQNLLPGMALSADLLLDRRRIIEWIFEPLYGISQRGGVMPDVC